jgi:hypothetical protein
MDRSAVKAIVDREIEPLMDRLGIGHWKIRVNYRPEATDEVGRLRHGECTRLVDYNSAGIVLNPEAFDDEADVLASLRHELFHVVLSPFDLFMQAARAALGDDRSALATLERVWDHAVEKAVINLGRIWYGLVEKPARDETGRTAEQSIDPE